MNDQKSAGSTRERLIFLVFGALLGVLPVFAASQLETRARAQHDLRDRRLAALKDYSTACARAIVAGRRFVEVEATLRDAASRKIRVPDSWTQRQADMIRAELDAIQVERRVTRDVINVLFNLELDILEFTPAAPGEASAGKELTVAEALPRFTRQCDETVRRLSLWL